jgi:hypothetical protein
MGGTMSLLNALLNAAQGAKTKDVDAATHNRMLREQIDKQLEEYERKLDLQVLAELDKVKDQGAEAIAKRKATLETKRAEGIQTLRDAGHQQYAKNCKK